jgi:sialate O-acetylesterase
VVQADRPVAVWGWASPGENVAVTLSGKTASATPGADGKWLLRLPAQSANAQPQMMTVRGKNTLTVSDVLVGEVWLGSGQSNMEMQLRGLHGDVEISGDPDVAARHGL